MICIKVKKGEPIDRALKRFSKKVNASGLFFDLRRKEFFKNRREMKEHNKNKKKYYKN